MEATLRIFNTSWIKRILCILLCLAIMLLTWYIDYMQVQAVFPLVLVAIPLGVKIIGGLLIAAGITFATVYAAEKCAEAYYAHTGRTVREDVNTMINVANNGVASIPASVWLDACEWVNSKFDVGQQTVSSNYADVQLDSQSETKYPAAIYANNMTSDIYPLEDGANVVYNGKTYTFAKVYNTSNGDAIAIYEDGVEIRRSNSISKTMPWSVYLNIREETGNKLQFNYRAYDISGNPVFGYLNNLDGSEAIGTAAVAEALPMDITGQAVIDTAGYDIVQPDGVTRQIAVPATEEDLLNKEKADVVVTGVVVPYSDTWTGTFRDCAPTGEYTFDGTGSITATMDSVGTWDGAWWTIPATGQREWAGIYTDAQGATWAGRVTEKVPDNATWWDKMFTGVTSGLAALHQLLVGTLAQIKAAIEASATGTQTKVQELTDAIAAENELARETDMTSQMRTYKIPDLFILILKVILACIRLILRALVFIATLPAIPASAGDVNSNFLSGVNFLKNQNIPFFGVSLWSVVTGVVAIFFGLAVVKRVRRIYSV